MVRAIATIIFHYAKWIPFYIVHIIVYKYKLEKFEFISISVTLFSLVFYFLLFCIKEQQSTALSLNGYNDLPSSIPGSCIFVRNVPTPNIFSDSHTHIYIYMSNNNHFLSILSLFFSIFYFFPPLIYI